MIMDYLVFQLLGQKILGTAHYYSKELAIPSLITFVCMFISKKPPPLVVLISISNFNQHSPNDSEAY